MNSSIKSWFQFHTGSIERMDIKAFSKRVKVFQFHTGSIERANIDKLKARFPEFQFHTGSIERTTEPRCDCMWITVSIPHWFD